MKRQTPRAKTVTHMPEIILWMKVHPNGNFAVLAGEAIGIFVSPEALIVAGIARAIAGTALAVWGVWRLGQYLAKKVNEHKDPYRRPSRHRKGVRKKTWDNAKDANGRVGDPQTKQEMDENEPLDMGHKPGYEDRKHRASARKRGILRKKYLDEHNNPDMYRPELPRSNRNHRSEDHTDIYFGP